MQTFKYYDPAGSCKSRHRRDCVRWWNEIYLGDSEWCQLPQALFGASSIAVLEQNMLIHVCYLDKEGDLVVFFFLSSFLKIEGWSATVNNKTLFNWTKTKQFNGKEIANGQTLKWELIHILLLVKLRRKSPQGFDLKAYVF